MRNSVGVSSAVRPSHDRVRAGIESQAPDLEREVGAAALDQRAQPRDELVERERLGQVVVAAGGEAGEAVGQRVAGGEEDHRRVDAPRAQRLDDVAPVRVGQADVDDEHVGLRRRAVQSSARRARGRRDVEPLLAQAARRQRAQLGVVLEHDHVWVDHCRTSIAADDHVPDDRPGRI